MKSGKEWCLIIALVIVSVINSFGQSLLWKVSGNELSQPSYLYGTIHLADERAFHFGDSVMAKFAECKVMAGEIVLEEDFSMKKAEAIRLPQDTTLIMLLSPEDYKVVKALAKEQLGGLLSQSIDFIKPIYTSFLFGDTKKGSTAEESIDEYFQKTAKKKGMKVTGLESMEEQFAALDKISLKDQAVMLMESIKKGNEEEETMEKMLEIYLSQDLNRLDSFMTASEMPDEMSQSLVLKRNYIMSERLQELIKVQSTFIAVGAAHLAGKEGLVELLRKSGYTVQPVMSKYSGNVTYSKPAKKTKSPVAGKHIYSAPNYSVEFPVSYEKKEENKLLAVDAENSMLYSLVEEVTKAKSVDEYLKMKEEAFATEAIEVSFVKRVKINGQPALSVQVKQDDMDVIFNYLYLGNGKGLEMSVVSQNGASQGKKADKFFNSFKRK